ncbi:MAG: asparagine synthase-related protein [Thermoleophilia bacterium]
MADLLLACTRVGHAPLAAERLRRAALRLAPPEVPPREPFLLEAAGVVAAVANPTEQGVWLHGGDEPAPGGGVGIGGLFGATDRWWQTGAPAPDGTCALARWDAGTVELLADICASRTLWYTLTAEALLASTSQRALVSLLGSFELQPEAVACFLSSGTLGPEVSWDARVSRVQPDARVILDRGSWVVRETRAPFDLTPAAGDRAAHVARLRDALTTTCAALAVDPGRWVLTLSGGRDSRALLAILAANGTRPRCITWTTRAALRRPLSDANIARRLARHFRAEHELWYLDDHLVDTGTALERFVAANEGRNDEINAYLDGLALWAHLRREGVCGVVRGDEAYGPRRHSPTPEDSRMGMGGATPLDYPEPHVLRSLGLAPQSWPPRLHVAPGESRLDYRLRTMQHGYIPIVVAGLNGLKARYVEVATPHLARSVVETVRGLPTDLRRHSRAFSAIADRQARYIPYARSSSTPSLSQTLGSPEMLETIVGELTAAEVERVLPGDGALHLLAALAAPRDDRSGAKARLKSALSALPAELTYRLLPPWKGPEALPAERLALRAVLAGMTIRLLTDDARDRQSA